MSIGSNAVYNYLEIVPPTNLELRKSTITVGDIYSDYYGFPEIQEELMEYDGLIDTLETSLKVELPQTEPLNTAEKSQLSHVVRMRKGLERYIFADVDGSYDELARHYSGIRCRVGEFVAAHDLVSKALREEHGDDANERIAALDAKRDEARKTAHYTLPWITS